MKTKNKKNTSRTWRRSVVRTLIVLVLCMSILPMQVFAAGWQNQGKGNWIYQKEDGNKIADGFTPDGYYIDGSGIWKENISILGTDFPARRSFLASSKAGSFVDYEKSMASLLKAAAKDCGDVRSIILEHDQIRYEAIADKTETELMSFYKNTKDDGYVLRLKSGLSWTQGRTIHTSWYDCQMVRAWMHMISRTGDQGAQAIYSSWESTNDYGLKLGSWVAVGDMLIRYDVSNGAGLYYIKANPDVK